MGASVHGAIIISIDRAPIIIIIRRRRNDFIGDRAHNRRQLLHNVNRTRWIPQEITTPSLFSRRCVGVERSTPRNSLSLYLSHKQFKQSMFQLDRPSRSFSSSASVQIIWEDSICKLHKVIYSENAKISFIHAHLHSTRTLPKKNRRKRGKNQKFFISFILWFHCLIFAWNLIWSAHIPSPHLIFLFFFLLLYRTKNLIECALRLVLKWDRISDQPATILLRIKYSFCCRCSGTKPKIAWT